MPGNLLRVVVAIVVIGVAGVAVAHRDGAGTAATQDQVDPSACVDRIEELMEAHRLAVRGL